MSEYNPDNWVVVKITKRNPDDGISNSVYKVIGGWSGGYIEGDSWRMNSGVTAVTIDESTFAFHGSSGSIYYCSKGMYGLRMSTLGIFNQLKDYADADESFTFGLMPEDTDWSTLDYSE